MVKVEQQRLQKEDILKLYTKGYTKPEDFKIGMEYERLPISATSYKAVDYWSEYGIKNFLEEFAKEATWDYINDDKNIIGLKKNHDTITLEPGCQIEISAEPQRNIFQLKSKIEKINDIINEILEGRNIMLLNYGVSPYSTHKSINLIPKKRYRIMANYLWGILSDVMMRETAGIQCCIDFKSEEDAMRKFKLANKDLDYKDPVSGVVTPGKTGKYIYLHNYSTKTTYHSILIQVEKNGNVVARLNKNMQTFGLKPNSDMDYYIEVSAYLKDTGNVFVAYVLTEKADTLRPSDYPTWGS